jgi:hypothetical protein
VAGQICPLSMPQVERAGTWEGCEPPRKGTLGHYSDSLLSAPVNRDSATAHNARDHPPRRGRRTRPVKGQAHGTVVRSRRQGLAQHGRSQQPRSKPRTRPQTCEACDGGFLMANMAGHLGLTGGGWRHDRRDEVAECLARMTVCPGPEKRDRIAQTRRESVVRGQTQRLSQGPSSCLLVTSENVSQHQGSVSKGLSTWQEWVGILKFNIAW